MTPRKDEIIDLQKLTQRELLIKLNFQLEILDKKLDKSIDTTALNLDLIEKRQDKDHNRVIKLETKVKSQSALFGAISGILTGIISIVIKIFVK